MKTIPLISGLLFVILSTGALAANQNPDWARGLDFERATEAADLIVVVKVEEVEHIRFMRGGKGESSVGQYKLKPMGVLKGVFAREELSLMSSDLGGYRFGSQMKQIQPGAILLLFLGRSDVGYENANSNVNSWQQSMPPLRNENDPLTDAVKALLAFQAEHQESKRVKILLDRLAVAEDIDAIPLFAALDRLAWVAAQNPDTAKIVAKQIASPNPLVSTAAADTASSVLAQDYLRNEAMEKELETALLAALDRQNANVMVRSALFGALGGLGNYGMKNPTVAAHLDIDQPVETFSDQSAKLEAVGRIGIGTFADKVLQYLQKLPLDAPSDLQSEVALCRIAPERAGVEILERISKKCAAGLDVTTDIASLNTLPPKQAVPALVKVSDSLASWRFGTTPGAVADARTFVTAASEGERWAFAQACLALSEKTPNETLVAPLTQLLDPDERSRGPAIESLIKINTDSAAKVLQPRLKEEQNLYSKLKITEFLGKHGIRDGYPYAMEHLSESGLLEQAVAALAAIKEPKAVPQLKQILATSNDVAWNRAAIRGLGALGVKEEGERFLEITGDWKNPLAAPALIALGDIGEIKALPKVREAFSSRNDEIVIAGVRSAAKLLMAHPDAKADDVRDRLAALLSAGDAAQGVRMAALEALVALNDPRLGKALVTAANDAGLEHSALFLKLLKERKIVLAK